LVHGRLRRAVAAMEKVAVNPTATARFHDSRRDEIGTMALAFNRMADALSENYLLLEKRVGERTSALSMVNKELVVSEARTRAIVDSALDCIITIDAQGKITEFNPAAEQTFGYRRQAVLGKELAELIVPERFRDAQRQGLARFLTTGEGPVLNKRLELQAVRADGTESPVEWAISAMGKGANCSFTACLRDVTERKQAEERLRESGVLTALMADVGVALTQGENLQDMLGHCAEPIVRHLDVAFARIWTLNERENVLELQASAGMYTHLDEAHSRVGIGQLRIGLIAQERKPHMTNQVIGDPRVGDQEWAKREGMVAFAGHPLMIQDRLLGVMALFSRHALSETTLETLGSVAERIALG